MLEIGFLNGNVYIRDLEQTFEKKLIGTEG